MIKKVRLAINPNAEVYGTPCVEIALLEENSEKVIQAIAISPENFAAAMLGLGAANALLAIDEDTLNG